MLHSVTGDAVDLFAVEFTSRECVLGGRSYGNELCTACFAVKQISTFATYPPEHKLLFHCFMDCRVICLVDIRPRC